jgi:hypothetical protein
MIERMRALIDADPRRAAIYLGRTRAGIGTVLVLAPRPLMRLLLGPTADVPAARWLVRALGIRDVVLGLGTAIAAAERRGGAGWLSMSAIADGGDAVASAITPGLPLRTRLVTAIAGTAAGVHWQAAQALGPLEADNAADTATARTHSA